VYDSKTKISSAYTRTLTKTKLSTNSSLSTGTLTVSGDPSVAKNPNLASKNSLSFDIPVPSFRAFVTANPPPALPSALVPAECNTQVFAMILSASFDVWCSGPFVGCFENGLADGGRGRQV
jgi:hypothetical protein